MKARQSLPIAILSFNRPEYLAKTLSSLQTQTKPLGDRQIALFQDGSWSPSMNKHHCDPALCRQCVNIFREQFPSATVFESDTNLGSVFNYERAERYVFETLDAPAAIFLEDDLILGLVYISVLEQLIDLALRDERVGYVTAFGNWKAPREQQLRNPRKLRPMHLLWAFGLTKRHWRKCRPYVEQYLDLVRGSDYRQRDHQKIQTLVQSWGIEPGDTGQDRIKAFATALAGCVMVNTEVAYGRYIGQKGGLNFTPALYKQWGLEKTEYFDEELSSDFDLSTVNFDPWAPGNNIGRISKADCSRPYDGAFFKAQSDGSKRSAEIIVPMVMGAVNPESVVDVGCGVGAWLREFERAGITDYLGIDGQYVPFEQLQIPCQRFRALDLITNRLSLERTYDLAVSLEVAEHLPGTQAEPFIRSLAELAPVILFSAAVPFQGGTGHVNEQWQDYWRGLFQKSDFVPVDFVRPRIWGNPKVAWWYQQNILLYVKRWKLPEYPSLEFHADGKTMDIVHPALLELTAKRAPRPSTSERSSQRNEANKVGALNAEDVLWCYRNILLREPESPSAVERHLQLKDFRELVRTFIDSKEFQEKRNVRPFVPLDRPAMEVVLSASPLELKKLHERIREAWTRLGTARNYHSVLSRPEFLSKNLKDEAVQRFWASGMQESGIIRAILSNHGFTGTQSKNCVEYGCGLGRLTLPLASMFRKVDAYDISPTHLEFAEKRAAGANIGNIEFHLCSRKKGYLELVECDIFYSRLVFQHNPPPIIHELIVKCLSSLRPGGIAIFQIPTHIEGYTFNLQEYLKRPINLDMEMHCITQSIVFELISAAQCRLLEVREDASIGGLGQRISNTFVAQRAGAAA